ncbi:MAG: hypothetical protein V2G42_02375 [bacterium JZ-2024 1]
MNLSREATALSHHSVDSARLVKGTLIFLVSNYLFSGVVTLFSGVRLILLVGLLSALWVGYFEFVADVLRGVRAPLSSIFRAFRYTRWQDFTDFVLLGLTFEFVYSLRLLFPYIHQQEGAAIPIALGFAFFFATYPAHFLYDPTFGIPRFLRFFRRWFVMPRMMLTTAFYFWLSVLAGLLAFGIGIFWGFPYAVKEALLRFSPLPSQAGWQSP